MSGCLHHLERLTMPSILHRYLLILLICCSILLTGCGSSFLNKQPTQDFSEQLYMNARLDFAIKHPLDWKRLQIPVSSPKYRADTIKWRVAGINQQSNDAGMMLIRSQLSDKSKTLPDLLSSYLAGESELKSSLVENFEHPAGPALKLLGHDEKQGHLIIALKGQQRDFIISLDFPSNRFAELLPIFTDIVNSFVEVVRPATTQQ